MIENDWIKLKITGLLDSVTFSQFFYSATGLLTQIDLVAAAELLVKEMFAQAVANPLEPGDHLGQLLDGVHLLLKEVALDEVAKLGVIVVTSNLVQIQQSLQKKNKFMACLKTVNYFEEISIDRYVNVLDSQFSRAPTQP